MKGDVALDLLDDLVDVAVEHGDRAEALQITERASGVGRAPAPFLVDRPHRQMGEDDNRGAGRTAGNVLLQPFELVVTQGRETGGFEPGLKIKDVDQPDKMDAGHIETVPALALRILAVAGEIGLAVVSVGHVVLAGNKENLLVRSLDDLIGSVPLFFLRQVTDVAGMDQERRLCRHRLDLGYRLAERGGRVRVCRQVKADMAVTDLHKGQIALRCLSSGC